MRAVVFAWIFGLLLPAVCPAAEHEISIPLQDGRLSITQLQHVLEEDLGVPPAVVPDFFSLDVELDLRSINGWLMVRGLNGAMGDGFHAAVSDKNLLIQFDPDKWPRNWNQSCDALGRFTEIAAPQAVARQNRTFGLHLPRVVDPHQPLVILIHGLDGDCACCNDLAKLLRSDHFQTAMFAYPAEKPLAEETEMLTRNMRFLHEQFPSMRVDLVTESMGGLIARKYVEGSKYAGGVDHFIMIAPPNAGSTWTPYALLLKVAVNASDWWHDPRWSPAWMITEGICQSASDLRPDSEFLAELNSHPRRPGVRYTIVAGDRPVGYRFAAEALEWSGHLIGDRMARWQGVRQIKSAMDNESNRLFRSRGDNDGPVRLNSARLAGVTDYVAVPADHVALYESIDGQSPAAWPTIQNRLTQSVQ
ncbi:MAG TPA: hypothetical protein VHX86_15530 [Tepidisphaeraceae bacterium]|jgi:hypothetical protein|nr:hypothetical protein [Tepidisphaeraceae bacterium]